MGTISPADPLLQEARELALLHLSWKEGYGDLWSLYRNPHDFNKVLDFLYEPFREDEVTTVVGVEARGFFFAGAFSQRFNLSFVPIRKRDSLLSGEKIVHRTRPDYRGQSHILRLQRNALGANDRVLIVDDWYETGSQAAAAEAIVSEAGAVCLGHSIVVNQLPSTSRVLFSPVHSVLTEEDLQKSAANVTG